jgi:hypothetical protein
MNTLFRKVSVRSCIAFTVLTVSACTVQAKMPKLRNKKTPTTTLIPLTATQVTLLNQAFIREKVTIKELQKRVPIVQTYIQNMKPDEKFGVVPSSDVYMLSRVDFSKNFEADSFHEKPHGKGIFKTSRNALSQISVALGIDEEYMPTGFMDMMFIDTANFDRQHYEFSYVRSEFLGTVRTQVFDVVPRKGTGVGRFTGRIWIEDQLGNVVRFNGLFTGNAYLDRPRYLHFDSWRTNQQPGLWLPAATYVEETRQNKGDDNVELRAQTSFWGYSLKLPTHESQNATVLIDDVSDQSDSAQDVSPLQASRAWVTQAEDNVLDRLVQAGVLAPPSDFDKVLETVTNNLIIGNKLDMPDAIHCRVLLTAPLESLAVGNTILLSRGLVDVLPFEEDLAAVLAFQLAHITLGHHIDTRYAFNDRLMFPDKATFQRITMNHSDIDDAAAAKKAVVYLNNSVYHDRLANAGLFFTQLQAKSKDLKALTTPRLGDSLLDENQVPWLAELQKNAPKLDADKLDQVAALPLGSHLRINTWDDKVSQMSSKSTAMLNAREKMPFQVTPIFFRLNRYTDPAAANSSASATTPADPGAPTPVPR